MSGRPFDKLRADERVDDVTRRPRGSPSGTLQMGPSAGILRECRITFGSDTVKNHTRHSDPKHYPVVIDDGDNTGALPGRGLRRGRGTT